MVRLQRQEQRESRARMAWQRLSTRLDEPVGSAGMFLKGILIPHIFVFVILLVVGGILEQGIESLLMRLGALGILLGVGLFVSSTREFVSCRLVVGEVCGLAFFVTVVSAIVRVEPLTHVYAPIMGLLAPLTFIAFPVSAGGITVAGLALLALLYTPFALVEWGVGSAILGGVSGVLLLGGLVIGRTRDATAQPRERARPSPDARERGLPPFDDRVVVDADDRMLQRDLQVLFNRTILGEFLGEVLWRIVAVSVAVGGMVCGLVFTLQPIRPLLALGWITLGAIQVALIIQIVQGREYARVARATLLSVFVIVGWWEIVVAETRIEGVLPEMLLALIMVWIAPLPWSRRQSFALCGIFTFAALVRLLQCPSVVLVVVGLLFLCPVVVRLSGMASVQLHARAALHFLRRIGEGSPTSLVACRALAWQLCTIIESSRALLLVGERRVEVLEGILPRATAVDPVFGRGLFHVINGRTEEEGRLSFRELSPQFLAPCVDWFGVVPTEFYFVRVFAIVEGREEQLILVVPCTTTARICGHARVLRIVGGLAAIVRGWLAAARGRFLSSDVILATQQSISAREEDLNHLVHLVNNVAQDISAECDDVRDLVRKGDGDLTQIGGTVDQIERLVLSLSAGVSDVKLLKELLRVRVLPASDAVDLASLIEDIGAFGKYRATRTGKPFLIEGPAGSGHRVSVASREFLAMVLRMLLRVAESRAPADTAIVLTVREEGMTTTIGVRDGGGAPDRERIEREMVRLDDGASNDRALEVYRAAYNLARLSTGRFFIAETPQGWEAAVALPRAAEGPGQTRTDGWILLVDDNPHVTSFYARVAEAMQQRYYTAASVEEARAIVNREGAPRLVVTDLQLGEGSGLDLLRELRMRFDATLPIVVVSGNTGPEVVDEVRAAGATSYLAKPVGRSRLFSELQALLKG